MSYNSRHAIVKALKISPELIFSSFICFLCSSANKCLLKVATYAAQLERYQKAIEIYEQVSQRKEILVNLPAPNQLNLHKVYRQYSTVVFACVAPFWLYIVDTACSKKNQVMR